MTTNPWHTVAEDVLAAMLFDKAWYERARFEFGITEKHFPSGQWRDVFQTVDYLRLADEPVHITAVQDRMNGKAPMDWLAGLYALGCPNIGGGTLDANLRILQRRAVAYTHMRTMELGAEAVQKATTDEERSDIVGRVIAALGENVTDTVSSATALDAGERFAAMMSDAPRAVIPTGIAWMDNNTGGMQRQQIWWIAAAYKMRKSTLMRNMALSAARAGASVTICALEGSQELVIAQLVAMMAVEWLIKNGLYHERDSNGRPLNLITASQLLTLRNRYKTVLDTRQVAAVSAGILEFKRLGDRIRVYDRQAQNGGLGTLTSVQTVLNRDSAMYGVDVCFIDYFQLIDAGRNSIYENSSYGAQRLQQIAGQRDIAMIVLAQLNEESVKHGSSDSHSPGVKGGGDPAATADFLFSTGYPFDAEGEPMTEQLRVMLRLARHGEAGKKQDFPMHPPTGLLLPEMPINLPKH